jgi:hypothetical protein
MNIFRKSSRIKVPDGIAVLAALLLLVSSLAGHQAALQPATGTVLLQGPKPITAATLQTDTAEMTTVSTPARKSRSFNISSLIFRF